MSTPRYPCPECDDGINDHADDGCLVVRCFCTKSPADVVDALLDQILDDRDPDDIGPDPGAYHLSGEHPDGREVW